MDVLSDAVSLPEILTVHLRLGIRSFHFFAALTLPLHWAFRRGVQMRPSPPILWSFAEIGWYSTIAPNGITGPSNVGVVVRGFPPLCRFSRQSDSWWRCLSTGCSWRWSCWTDRAACSCVAVEGRVNEEDDALVVNGKWENNKCADQMTDSCQAHKDDMQFLSQARAMRSALLNRLYCAVLFSGPFSRKPKSPPSLRWCSLPWAPTR